MNVGACAIRHGEDDWLICRGAIDPSTAWRDDIARRLAILTTYQNHVAVKFVRHRSENLAKAVYPQGLASKDIHHERIRTTEA